MMLTFDIGELQSSIRALMNLASIFDVTDAWIMPEQNKKDLENQVEALVRELTAMDLQVTLRSAIKLRKVVREEIIRYEITENTPREVIETIRADGPTFIVLPIVNTKINNYVKEVNSRITDELSTKLALLITSDRSQYVTGVNDPFKGDIRLRFSSVKYEFDEALKCLGLDRSTASAFHCMRILEAGVRAVSRCLSIADPTKPAEKNWGFILGEVKKELDRRWPKNKRMPGTDGALFEELYTTMDAAKNSLRNSTMHLDKVYTETEAEDILRATANFMGKLANRCDENGVPKA